MSDERPHQHYSLKHRVIAWISRSLFGELTYTVRHGYLKGLKRKGGLGWVPDFVAGASTKEDEFWTSQDFTGRIVYDIGSFVGLIALHMARTAKQVICYEPNSRNFERLMANVLLNNCKNVLVRRVGVGSNAGTARMAMSVAMPGGASIDEHLVEGMVNSQDRVRTEEITTVTIDEDVRASALPPPGFVKIDVEGYELNVLKGARNTLIAHKPQIFIENHGETMSLKIKAVTDIVQYLNLIGYRDIVHIETGTHIQLGNAEVAAEGHLFCT